MTVEHTVRDVAEDDLEQSLNDMGADGWELAAAIPMEHRENGEGQYAVSSIRLLFKRSNVASLRSREVAERCGVDIYLRSQAQAALVLYFPASWDGEMVNIRPVEKDSVEMQIGVTSRRAADGNVYSIILRSIWLSRSQQMSGLRYNIWTRGRPDKRLDESVFVFPGFNEFDFIDKLSA